MDALLVPPDDGFKVLGVKKTKGWELIKTGQIEAVKIGRSTRITVASIKAFVDSAERVKIAA